tara:strand:- start:8248 stop:8763 length:516 start_codon:yes stop_codon:yes gene_type:complete
MTEEIITIKDTSGYIITLDNVKFLFTVKLKQEEEYDEPKYDEFLLYLENTWGYIKNNNLTYHLLVDLQGTGNKENELPIGAYMKLIKTLTAINSTLNNHCHSVCILTSGSEKWKTAYQFATKLWSPHKQRPLIFTENIDDVASFFNSHKLYIFEEEWAKSEDGGFIRRREN